MELPENYAFVDGSYNDSTKAWGYGGFLVLGDEKTIIKGLGETEEYAVHRNIAGEVTGAMMAVHTAIKKGVKHLTLFYDYEGIFAWPSGKWKAKTDMTKKYAAYMKRASDKINIEYVHVKAHSGIPGNEEADALAKEAVGIT